MELPAGYQHPLRSGATGQLVGTDGQLDSSAVGPGSRSWEAGSEEARDAARVFEAVMGDRRRVDREGACRA